MCSHQINPRCARDQRRNAGIDPSCSLMTKIKASHTFDGVRLVPVPISARSLPALNATA
jgi:hypothetical protein